MSIKRLQEAKEFEWDQGNLEKNWLKHGVSPIECEQVFFNQSFIAPDVKHSEQEDRFFALGRTDLDRYLFLVFTLRRHKIRIISARNMNRKERKIYGS